MRSPEAANRMACPAVARVHSPPSPGGLRRDSLARLASEGWWGKKDSNLRSHKTADLQSSPFATRDTPPLNSIEANPPERRQLRLWMTLKPVADGGRPVGRVYEGIGPAKSTCGAARNRGCYST